MDARNKTDQTLDVRPLGVYGVAPGQTVRESAGDVDVSDEAIGQLLEQVDVWSRVGPETDKRPKPAPAAPPA